MLDILPTSLRNLLLDTPELKRAYLVGGCVRDWLLGQPVKDFDIEVHGLSQEDLVAVLSRHGRADLVGVSFGVVKLNTGDGFIHDFSLPRRDSKVSVGHKGFCVEFDPSIPPAEASARRDFTINSLMYAPRENALLDPHGGADDLRNRVLRHTGPAFVEDPLRVLRGMQFCARLCLDPAPATLELCRAMAKLHAELAVERIREEWFKWATRSTEPSRGLRFLQASGWLQHYPELAALPGVPQDAGWHPEGDVWTHTGHCLDALVELPEWREADDTRRAVLMFAVLLHDVGKPACTRREMRDGRERVVSPGHDHVAGPLAGRFLVRMGVPESLRARILPLVTQHMAHLQVPSPRAIRRLANRLQPATVRELATVMTADASGRPPSPRRIPAEVIQLLAVANAMEVASSPPRRLLLGRHLIARGLHPGPDFGPWLDAAFEAQLDGSFSDLPGAEAWLDQRLRSSQGP